VLGPEIRQLLPSVNALAAFQSSPITGVHLWFDRPITNLPHAVLIDRLSQWLFSRGMQLLESGATAHYYQVVISASRMLADCDREQVVQRVVQDLSALWPAARDAKLLQSKVVTEQHAVFTPSPGLNHLRPDQQSSVPGLYLAGDWTATGWPSTMESAIRSGHRAAHLVKQQLSIETR
jgi:uncharacterized protein with NAD-binding domain and iron-sulfur cluster